MFVRSARVLGKFCGRPGDDGMDEGKFTGSESAGRGSAPFTASEICARAQDSDEWARRAVEREGYYLGLGLANLITLFAPEAIVLGGSVMKSAHLFLDRAREVIRQNCRLVPAADVEISLASLGSDAGLIGAAEVWNHRFETSPQSVR